MQKIAYVIVGLLLLSVVGCKSTQKISRVPSGGEITAEKEKPKKTVYEVAEIPTETTAQTETSKVVEEPKIAEEPVVIEEPAIVVEETRAEKFEVVVGETTPTNQYFVVVGSFKSETNAQNLQNRLLSEQHQAVIARNDSGMFRVIIASFQTYDEAKTERNIVRAQFADAWILVQQK